MDGCGTVLISCTAPGHGSDWTDIPSRSSRPGWPSGRHSFGATRDNRTGASDFRKVSAAPPAPARATHRCNSKTCLTTTTARICLTDILRSHTMDNQVFCVAFVYAIVAERRAQDCILDDACHLCWMGNSCGHPDLHPLQSSPVLHK